MNQARHFFAFIRHGEYFQKTNTPSALQPYGLTAEGIQQSASAAQKLHQLAQTFDAQIESKLFCSPLLRAWQTAEILSKVLFEESNITETPNLVERQVGSVANLSISEIEKLIDHDPRYETPPKGWKSNSHYQLPFIGAESLMMSGERVANAIDSICQSTLNTTQQNTLIVIVGHGASFRHAAYLKGVLSFADIRKFSMFHADPLLFEYHPEAQWQHLSGEWKIREPQTLLID